MTLSVRFVGLEREVPDELWAACFPPHLEGRWWYQALEAAGIEDQFTFLYAIVEHGHRPVGIAPLFVGTAPVALALPPLPSWLIGAATRLVPSVLAPRTLFVGSPCADEGTIGVRAEVDRREAFAALDVAVTTEAWRRGLDLVVWKDMPDSDCQYLDAIAADGRLFRMIGFPGTVVSLPGRTKSEYFAALSGSRRHRVKKKIRSSVSHVDVAVEVVKDPAPPVLDEIFALFWQTYERARTRFERLNRRFFVQIARQPVSYFIVLRESRTADMLAFMLCFDTGSRIINKFIGIDYRRPRAWRLYHRLWDAAIDWALTRGAHEIQSGQTGYALKLETGHRLVPLTNFGRHRKSLVHRLFSVIARSVTWASLDPELAAFVSAHGRRPARHDPANSGPAAAIVALSYFCATWV